MDALKMIEEKLKTQSVASIIDELKQAEEMAKALYGEIFKTIEGNIYEFENTKYIVSSINQHGQVFLNRILHEIVEGHYVCGGKGYAIHIDELLKTEIT